MTQITPFVFLANQFESFSKEVATLGANEEESEIVQLLIPTINKFAKEYINALKIDEDKTILIRVLKQAKDLGLFGLTIAEKYGGSGLSLKAACRVISEMAIHDSAFSTTVGLHAGLGTRGLNRFGSEFLKDKYLGDLASGSAIAAFAATETSAGSHIANVQTRAVYDEKSSHLIINGSKIYVTNGGFADVYTILASTPDLGGHKKGLSLILIPRTAEGVIIGEEEGKLGLKGSSTTSLFFEDVKVGVDHIIGTPSEALKHFEDVLSWGRTLMSAGCLGTARFTLKKAIDYAQIRNQFGGAISSFSLIQEKISRMSQCLFTMESIIKMVGQTEASGRDVVFESSIAKILSSEGVGWICDESIQIHGGSGFIEETGVAKPYRDVRVARIFEGSNEMLRLHIAMHMLSWKQAELEELSFGSNINESLKPHLEESKEIYSHFLFILQSLKKRYKFSILKKQLALKKLAEAAMSVYSVYAVLAHASGLLDSGISPDEKKYYLTLSKAILFEEKQKMKVIRESVENDPPYSHEELANLQYERNLSE